MATMTRERHHCLPSEGPMLHRMAPDDDRELVGRLFSNAAPPFVAAREELLTSVERWRAMVRRAPPASNTLWFGVAVRAVTLAEVLMRQAVDVVAPPGEVPEKATLGDISTHRRKYMHI